MSTDTHRNAGPIHVASLSASKIGDGLADPKIMLAWLVSALGAPVWMAGALVPIREAGALLPQLLLAGPINRARRAKRWWGLGAVVQGLAVLTMALAAWRLQEAAAGWVVLAALCVFALARACCSVSYKIVLGRTVEKGRRGGIKGVAGSLGGLGVLTFGALVAMGAVPASTDSVALVLALAGLGWVAGGLLFLTLDEVPPDAAADPDRALDHPWAILREDPDLRRFIAARGCLTVTALGPPFLLAGAGVGPELGGGIEAVLGPFVIAGALAALTAGWIWGRLADRSSRGVLILCGALAAPIFVAAAALTAVGWDGRTLALAVLLYLLMVVHQGVRSGRSTYLTDMADDARRGPYTAVSNTAIGLLLLAAGGFGMLAAAFGSAVVLLLFACLAGLSVVLSRGLPEVQDGPTN